MQLRGQQYEINIKNWGINDGLSDRQVNGIYKDSRGFIWACTRNGINCFDGYSFKPYTKEQNGLPFSYTTSVTEDANGQLWILGSTYFDSHNLYIFDPLAKKVELFKDKTGYKSTFRFNFLQKFNDSTLFFGKTSEQYFFTWHPRSGLSKIHYPVNVLLIIAPTDSNTLWVQNDASQLCEIDMQGRLIRKVATDHKVDGVTPDIKNFAVYKWSDIHKSTLKVTTKIEVNNGKADLINTYSNFNAVSFNTGIDNIVYREGALYHPEKGLLIDFGKEGMPNLKANFRQVLIDNDNRIWACNTYGLYMLTMVRSKFRKYFYQEERIFSQNSYRNLVTDNNVLYAVNEFLGVQQTVINPEIKSPKPVPIREMHANYTLIKTNEGSILGMQNGYLFSLDRGNHKWNIRNMTLDSHTLIWKIHQVATDSFLVGTSEGLEWLNVKKNRLSAFTQYNKYIELSRSLPLDIIPDHNGSFWICSNKGLYNYDTVKGIIARYSINDTGVNFLPAAEYQHLYQDSDGIYWLATTSGLLMWNKQNGKYRLYTRKDGMASNNIYAVYEDALHRLWLSSDNGIILFNKVTGHINTYLKEHGVTNNEFNRVSHTRDGNGNIYFGTLNGVTAFNPDDFHPDINNSSGVALSVLSFEQFIGKTNRLEDKTADLVHTNNIILNPGDRFFNINFALLTFNDAINSNYYWKIEGVDSDWNKIRDPFLRLSGLPFGKWKLRIKAQASDGINGRNELNFNILVVKPFYLHIWFILLCGLILILGVLGGYRWRILKLKKENERLDDIVNEKTLTLERTINELKVSSQQKDMLMKEIHHRVKNNLQIISSLLNLQLTKIHDDMARVAIEEGITRISSIALIHHYLYKDDSNSIEFGGFVKELIKQVSAVYHKERQQLMVNDTVPETLMDIDTALPLGLILNELVTNSYKYAFSERADCKISVALEQRATDYVLRYSDNGPGLPENYDVQTIRSLGMILIKSLSKQLGGGFSYYKDENSFVIVFKDTIARKNIA
jgi:two-component sensor histidine kinase